MCNQNDINFYFKEWDVGILIDIICLLNLSQPVSMQINKILI